MLYSTVWSSDDELIVNSFGSKPGVDHAQNLRVFEIVKLVFGVTIYSFLEAMDSRERM